MRAYVIRRVLLVIPTLFIVTLLVFLSVRFIPGDIIDVMTARMTFSGSGSIDEEALIIPALILGTYLAASTMRMTRMMMLEVLRQDYVRTAWAKGLKERRVVLRHAVKNALIPVVTLVALQMPIIAGGSVIIENIFNLPGLGRLMLVALNERDYPVVSGINLLFASVVVVINLLTDLT